MFTADNDASITAHGEYNIKLGTNLRVLRDSPVFVRLPLQKSRNLIELILFHTRTRLNSMPNVCQRSKVDSYSHADERDDGCCKLSMSVRRLWYLKFLRARISLLGGSLKCNKSLLTSGKMAMKAIHLEG